MIIRSKKSTAELLPTCQNWKTWLWIPINASMKISMELKRMPRCKKLWTKNVHFKKVCKAHKVKFLMAMKWNKFEFNFLFSHFKNGSLKTLTIFWAFRAPRPGHELSLLSEAWMRFSRVPKFVSNVIASVLLTEWMLVRALTTWINLKW